MAEWTWDPDDFAALWYSAANDRFPDPLHYRSRFELRDEFAAHRHAVRERYTTDELQRIQLALHTLSTSDVRIEILGGTTKHKARDGAVTMYRIVGARNTHHAVTLFQSASTEQDGPIRLRTFRPENLPAGLAAAIPTVRPGKQQSATFHPDDLRPRKGFFEDVARNTPRERYRRLLRRPSDGGGSAGLLTGAVNKLSTPWHVLQWHDITGDGRYTEVRAGHITVQPTTPTDLAARFTSWIDNALQRLNDEANANW